MMSRFRRYFLLVVLAGIFTFSGYAQHRPDTDEVDEDCASELAEQDLENEERISQTSVDYFWSAFPNHEVLDQETTRRRIKDYQNLQRFEERLILNGVPEDDLLVTSLRQKMAIPRNQIILGHYRMAIKYAQNYYRKNEANLKGTSVDDLIMESILALDEAVAGFDLGRDVKFSTYAYSKMRGRLTKYRYAAGHVIARPVQMQDYLVACQQAMQREKDLREIPELTPDEIGIYLNKDRAFKNKDPIEYEIALLRRIHATSMIRILNNSSTRADTRGLAYIELQSENRRPGAAEEPLPPLERMIHDEEREGLAWALETLDERERFVVKARFGIDGMKGSRTLGDIGDEIGLTRERVRQIEAKALEKMRESIQQRQVTPRRS